MHAFTDSLGSFARIVSNVGIACFVPKERKVETTRPNMPARRCVGGVDGGGDF